MLLYGNDHDDDANIDDDDDNDDDYHDSCCLLLLSAVLRPTCRRIRLQLARRRLACQGFTEGISKPVGPSFGT